jgi:hypothetical protein
MRNRRKQGNVIPQKDNNLIIEDLVDSDVDETSVSEVKRIKPKTFKELIEECKNKSINTKRI